MVYLCQTHLAQLRYSFYIHRSRHHNRYTYHLYNIFGCMEWAGINLNDSFGPFNSLNRIKRSLSPALLIIAICLPGLYLFAQPNAGSIQTFDTLHLQKRKKMVDVYKGDYIGITTAAATIKYFGENIHSFKILKIDKYNFTLRRPLVYKDTIIESKKLSLLDGREHLFGKPFRTGKIYYASIVLVDSYEYKTIPLKNITSIQYPPDAGNTMGCMSCAIIPIYNIFYFIDLRKRWHPKNFPIGKWRIEI